MINNKELRAILKEIFGIPDNHLLQLSDSMFVPTIDREDKIGDWIGYRVLDKQRTSRAYSNHIVYQVPLKVKCRVVFVGPHAAELCNRCLLWDDRQDVIKAFAQYDAQLFYNDRDYYSYPVRNKGFNDSEAWVVDFLVLTVYKEDTNIQRWDLTDVLLEGTIIVPQEVTHGSE